MYKIAVNTGNQFEHVCEFTNSAHPDLLNILDFQFFKFCLNQIIDSNLNAGAFSDP
jgi:hypothetical protein